MSSPLELLDTASSSDSNTHGSQSSQSSAAKRPGDSFENVHLAVENLSIATGMSKVYDPKYFTDPRFLEEQRFAVEKKRRYAMTVAERREEDTTSRRRFKETFSKIQLNDVRRDYALIYAMSVNNQDRGMLDKFFHDFCHSDVTYQDLLATRMMAEPTYVNIQGRANVSREIAAVLSKIPDGVFTIHNSQIVRNLRTGTSRIVISAVFRGHMVLPRTPGDNVTGTSAADDASTATASGCSDNNCLPMAAIISPPEPTHLSSSAMLSELGTTIDDEDPHGSSASPSPSSSSTSTSSSSESSSASSAMSYYPLPLRDYEPSCSPHDAVSVVPGQQPEAQNVIVVRVHTQLQLVMQLDENHRIVSFVTDGGNL
eukprot:gene33415-40423_t